MPSTRIDLKRSLRDPQAAFGTPQRLLAEPHLSLDDKRAILLRWEQDARELSVAEEEGMAGGEPSMLDRVLQALAALGTPVPHDSPAPTKHGGVVLPGVDAIAAEEVVPGRVGQVMQSTREIVHPDHTLREALARMQAARLPFLPVADGDEIVGVVTAQDLRDMIETGERAVWEASVRDHMSSDVAFCYDTDSADTALKVMQTLDRERLCVFDSADELVGIVTRGAIETALRTNPPAATGASPSAELRHTKTASRAKAGAYSFPKAYASKPRIKP